MKADVLAFAAHPDDAEISAGGTLAKLVSQGRKVVVVDLTRGELGSRGNGVLRLREAEKASEILGLSARENLGMPDGFFSHDEGNLKAVIRMIRKYQPEIVLANSISDRHPDHSKAAKLVAEAFFLSGLHRVSTRSDNADQQHWRPKALYHFIQDYYIKPDFVVDVSAFFEQKMEAIRAFSSQFYREDAAEPETPISGKEFFDFLRSRAMEFGRPIGALYAEGFTAARYPGVNDLFDLV